MRIIDCIQGSPEWFAAKRGIPSASNFDRIITPKKGQLSAGAFDLICELIADAHSLTPPSDLEPYMSRAMRNGTETEPEARRWYCLERDVEVQEVGFCLSDCGRYGCSPDALVGPDGGVEIKCPDAKTQVKYLLGGTLPDDYKPQVHGCLLATGRKWWDFCAYSRGLPSLLVRVEPDDYTEQLRKCLEDFLAKFREVLDRFLPVTVAA